MSCPGVPGIEQSDTRGRRTPARVPAAEIAVRSGEGKTAAAALNEANITRINKSLLDHRLRNLLRTGVKGFDMACEFMAATYFAAARSSGQVIRA